MNTANHIFHVSESFDPVPEASNRLAITVHSTLVDRWAGLSQTYEVWGTSPNKQYVTDALADDAVRKVISDFFVNRAIGNVLTSIVPIKSLKPSDQMLTKKDLFDGVVRAGYDTKSAGIIVELCLPLLTRIGLVNPNMKYSRHERYVFRDVSVGDLKTNIASFQVLQAVDTAQGSSINPSTKYSTSVLAETIAESLRGIGLALLEVDSLNSVIDDIVKGVRAHIDPSLSAGVVRGSVPNDWRNHKVVVELATNYVFVKAALELPVGSKIDLSNEGFSLDRWSPMILAAIKSSERYAWIGKAEYLRNFSLRKVRSVAGVPKCVVVHQLAKVQPVAQSVIALTDAMLTEAYNISPTKDRIAEAVQSAYGVATFSTAEGADLVYSLLSDAAEAGWTGMAALYAFDVNEEFDRHLFAVMLSNRVWVVTGEDGPVIDTITSEIDTEWRPKWWYSVSTSERSLKIVNGVHMQSEVLTNDAVEALLAANEFDALEAIPARPQVLGASAFNTRVVGFDERVLHKVNERFAFDLSVAGVVMRGSFRAADFGSLRTIENTSLVVPHFNVNVIESLQHCYWTADHIVKRMHKAASKPSDWVDGVQLEDLHIAYANRKIARTLLQLSQQLSPAFRRDVHNAIVERTVLGSDGKNSHSESVILRARLHQKTFAACADVIALRFFLFLQGIKADVWDDVLRGEELYRACMEIGSDRS